MINYTARSAISRAPGMTYRVSYRVRHTPIPGSTRDAVFTEGVIDYLYNDGSHAPMTRGPVDDIRVAWHRQCRLNRARRAGRPYRHIIENRPYDPTRP